MRSIIDLTSIKPNLNMKKQSSIKLWKVLVVLNTSGIRISETELRAVERTDDWIVNGKRVDKSSLMKIESSCSERGLQCRYWSYCFEADVDELIEKLIAHAISEATGYKQEIDVIMEAIEKFCAKHQIEVEF